MNEDIRVSLDFWDHHKTVRLKMKLGYEGIEALQRLWFYTAKFRPDGHLTNMDEIDISIACKWKGEVKDLMETLTDKKYPWLDWRDDHYHLHNWEKRNGYAIHAEARAEKARRAANTRWEKRNKVKENQKDNAKCIVEHDAKNAISNAPSPAPAPIPSPSPNPTPPPLGKSKPKNHSLFSYEEWQEHIKTSFDLLSSDRKWLDTMIERYPRTNIPATIEEAREYWAGYEGYEKKKGSRNCNWKTTLQNTFKADWLKVPKDISQKKKLTYDEMVEKVLAEEAAKNG